LVEPERTSPIANTPRTLACKGGLVASASGPVRFRFRKPFTYASPKEQIFEQGRSYEHQYNNEKQPNKAHSPHHSSRRVDHIVHHNETPVRQQRLDG
jgi:hypothetical protein